MSVKGLSTRENNIVQSRRKISVLCFVGVLHSRPRDSRATFTFEPKEWRYRWEKKKKRSKKKQGTQGQIGTARKESISAQASTQHLSSYLSCDDPPQFFFRQNVDQRNSYTECPCAMLPWRWNFWTSSYLNENQNPTYDVHHVLDDSYKLCHFQKFLDARRDFLVIKCFPL